MSMTASVASPVAANPLGRFTIGLLGLFSDVPDDARPAPHARSTVLEIGPDEMGRMVHAVFRRASSLHR